MPSRKFDRDCRRGWLSLLATELHEGPVHTGTETVAAAGFCAAVVLRAMQGLPPISGECECGPESGIGACRWFAWLRGCSFKGHFQADQCPAFDGSLD